MTSEERMRLEQLDGTLRSDAIREQISPVISRVRAELARKPEAVMTWEPIPLEVFGGALPAGIRSSWVFVLRAGADTGAERHPNSHQRMMSAEGSGDMRTAHARVEPQEMFAEEKGNKINWRSNVLVSDPAAPLEQRWVSIPPNVWHRPVVGNDSDWVVISFHTVHADELIEERPDPRTTSAFKQMRYLAP